MRIAAVVWLIVLVAVCLSPFGVKSHLHTPGRLHPAYHVGAFFITGCLLAWQTPSWARRILLLLVAAGLGPFTEWLEARAWGNAIEWRDVWTDLSGVTLALIALAVSALSARRQEQFLRPIPLASVPDDPRNIPERHQ